jgi:hypothetical protein
MGSGNHRGGRPSEERTLEELSRALDEARAQGVRWPFPPRDEAERWARERFPDLSFWDEHVGKGSVYDIAVEGFRAGVAYAQAEASTGRSKKRPKPAQ